MALKDLLFAAIAALMTFGRKSQAGRRTAAGSLATDIHADRNSNG